MAKIKSVRGMNDIPPEQALYWRYAEEIISTTFSFVWLSRDQIPNRREHRVVS